MFSRETFPSQLSATLPNIQQSNHREQVTSREHSEQLAFYTSRLSITGADARDHFDHFISGQDQSQAYSNSSSRSFTPDSLRPFNERTYVIPADSQQVSTKLTISDSVVSSELPDSHLRNSQGLFFSSFPESYSAIPLPEWPLDLNDITIPETKEDCEQWIWKLFHALNNIENVHDKPSPSFRKNWFDPVNGPSTIYSWEDKEKLCWQIFCLAKDLHCEGPRVLESFDPMFWRYAVKTRGWTFQQRIEKIIKVIKYSKARCTKMLNGAGQIKALVANPENLSYMTVGNAKQNGARQVLLTAGRAIDQEKAKTETTMPEIKTEPTL